MTKKAAAAHKEPTPPPQNPDQPATPPPPPPPKKSRQHAGPLCPVHGVPMIARRSTPYYTYYYCPEDGCTESNKQMRPNLKDAIDRKRRKRRK